MPQSAQSQNQFKHSLAAEVLRSTGWVRLAALGNSMLPALWPGDFVTIQAASLDQIQTGDVVLFARDRRFFIHRALRKVQLRSETRLLTRGDAMPKADAPVAAEELLGKVVFVERGSRPSIQVPACSLLRRCLGLTLAYFASVRSIALRWHVRRSPAARGTEFASEQVPMG